MTTKADLKLLERVFQHEVTRAIERTPGPFQSRAKGYQRLRAEGLVERVTYEIPVSGPFPSMTAEGWELTHAGRFVYCDSCRDEPEMHDTEELSHQQRQA